MQLTWEYIQQAVRSVTNSMATKNYKPDILVPIIRGGLVPARLIASYYDKARICPIRAHWSNDGGHVSVETWKYTDSLIAKQGSATKINILIIDDITDTGNTLIKVTDHIKYLMNDTLFDCLDTIKTTTLIHKSYCARITPDFVGHILSTEAWIDFPWETCNKVSL